MVLGLIRSDLKVFVLWVEEIFVLDFWRLKNCILLFVYMFLKILYYVFNFDYIEVLIFGIIKK